MLEIGVGYLIMDHVQTIGQPGVKRKRSEETEESGEVRVFFTLSFQTKLLL